MIASYRDPRYAASIRIAQLRERHGERKDDIPEDLIRIYSRRTARSWAGGVAIAGFVAIGISSILSAVGGRSRDVAFFARPTFVLVSSVVLSVVTYVAARLIADMAGSRRVREAVAGGKDELSRLARLEDDSFRRAAADVAGAGERRSIALPMAGVGLLAPLSIHFAIWAALNLADHGKNHHWIEEFDTWIGMSLVLVGVAHIVLAYLGARFADKMAEAPLPLLEQGPPMGGWRALIYTFVASFLPGIIAIMIPPLIVLATGALFIPAMFSVMYKKALFERRALADDR